MALQDPRPLNPLAMGDRQIYVLRRRDRPGVRGALAELFKYLPGKVAQCRIFARDHRHDAELTRAFRQVLRVDGAPRPTS